MPELMVKTFVTSDENIRKYVFINSANRELFNTDQVEVSSEHGNVLLDIAFDPLVPVDCIGLDKIQQKIYRLKNGHRYTVLSYPSPVPLTSIFNDKFKYRERVGGLDHVFETIFRRVLLRRLYPKSFVNRTGLKKPRGFILYGSPSTGKTLIAKTVADILKVEPKIVNGPELFTHLLGQSEEKVRDLFKVAHLDQQKYGLESPLHVIIFDEIDAVCKIRSTEDSAARNSVYNNITSQILTEIDGAQYLDNILVIGTTNVIQAIDPALYRPGRLHTLIEVGTPDAKGRSEIFNIYTKTLLQHCLLSNDIDIKQLIDRTGGMTGAHIKEVVHEAVNAAMKRDVQNRGTLDISNEDAKTLEIKNVDFTMAIATLEREFHRYIELSKDKE